VRGYEGEEELTRLAHLPLSDECEEEIVQVDDQRDESMLAQARSQRQDAELGPRSHVGLSDQLRIDEVGDGQSGDEADGELAGYTFE
jgi:hypothetical protein